MDLNLKICHQIDYYFCDFNLNKDKYLRNVLYSSKSISFDDLLKFNMIRRMSVELDRKDLLEFISKYQFQNARFMLDSQSFCRNPDNPFVYDKNFLKKNSKLILYIKNLPPQTLITDIINWASDYGFIGVNVLKRDEKNKNIIHSALVVFKNENCVQFLLEFRSTTSTVPFGSNEIFILSYKEYLKYRNKLKRKKKEDLKLSKLSKLSINDQPSDSANQKHPKPAKKSLIKRTIFMGNIPNKMIDDVSLKQALKEFGLLYLYSICRTEYKDFYLFFRNRSMMIKFYEKITKESKLEFSFIMDNNNQINFKHLVTSDNFNMIDPNALSEKKDFRKYIKSIKSFFAKKNKSSTAV